MAIISLKGSRVPTDFSTVTCGKRNYDDFVEQKEPVFRELSMRLIDQVQLGTTRSKRIRLSHMSNITASRKLISASPEELRDRYIDHACRRLQFFYYQCVIFAGEGCKIETLKTQMQHGIAKHLSSSAAHSCILPELKDDFFDKLLKEIEANGLSPKSKRILIALGVSENCLANKQLPRDQLQGLVRNIAERDPEGLLSPSSHFYQSMNSTVEIPWQVNEKLDGLLETYLRDHSLNLLNDVSQSKIQAYQACRMLEGGLQILLYKVYLQCNDAAEALEDLEKVYLEVHQIQEKKHFTFASSRQFVKLHKRMMEADEKLRNLEIPIGLTHVLQKNRQLMHIHQNYLTQRGQRGVFDALRAGKYEQRSFSKEIALCKKLSEAAVAQGIGTDLLPEESFLGKMSLEEKKVELITRHYQVF
jgi:hypothetical protein